MQPTLTADNSGFARMTSSKASRARLRPSRVRRWLPASLGALAFAASFALPSTASAQEWLKDRRYQEGAGIRTGDLELHPGVGAEAGYDSNWLLRTHHDHPGVVNGNPKGAGVIRVTPSFSISTLGAQRAEGSPPGALKFRANIAATYREFIGPKEIRDQNDWGNKFSGLANFRFDVYQGRPVAFGVFGGYQRLIQPSVLSDPSLTFNRSVLNGGGDVTFTPGGGTLDIRTGYQVFGTLFEQTQGAPFSNVQHEVSVRDRWKFRPRTALFSDTSLRFVSYPNADRALTYLNDATPLRTRFGVTGLVTERIGTTLAAGYGATFFQNPAAASSLQYDSFLAQAEGTFYLSSGGAGTSEPGEVTLLLSTISLGYLRDFQMSYVGNYYSTDRGYGKLVYAFSGKGLLSLNVYGERLAFPQTFYNAGGGVPVAAVGAFDNYRVGGTLYGELRLSDSFALTATGDYQETISDTLLPAGPVGGAGAAPGLFDMAWRRWQALAGVRWFL